MGDDITIGVTEIVNNIEVTAQPNDQVIDIEVIDNSDDVTLNVTPNVIEVNINKGSSYARWGSIFGNLTDQADLTNALFNKADLVDGKVPSYQLPSFVDDVIEVANYAALPTVGEIGKIYITLDDNKIYRWSGSIYIEIASNQAIWGAITGSLTNQTDLVNALNLKANISGQVFTGAISATNLSGTNTGDQDLSGLVPNTRTLTINGTTFDLSANRTYTIPTHDAVTLGTANGLSLSGQVLSLDLSGASSTGALSSTDWNTFNNKLSSLSGAVLTTTDQSVAGVKTFTNLSKFTNNTGSFAVEIDTTSSDSLVVKNGGSTTLQISRSGQILGSKYIISGGFSSQFLKANGDLDSTVYTPASRTITINGVTQDLTANRSFTIASGVTSVFGRTGDVVAANGDYTTTQVTEGTNLYYTEARVNANANVAANTAARHSAVTIGTSNGLSLSGQALSLALASSSTTGALSAADWNTFNNKQNTITNPITGSGTINFLPKFTQSGSIGNSQIFDNGTNVAIGTSGSTGYKFFVSDSSTGLGTVSINNTNTSNTGNAFHIDYRGLGKIMSCGNGNELFSVSRTGGGYFAGNVGIGTPSPVSLLNLYSDSNLIQLQNSTTGSGTGDGTRINLSGNDLQIINRESANTIFFTADTERMRITSSGRVFINTTTGVGEELFSIGFNSSTSLPQAINIKDTNASANNALYLVFRKSDDGGIGNIQRIGTTNAVAYNTTSDYRLKEDFKPINGLDLVSKIKVYDFKWKGNEARMDGVIAHELQEVLPYAVSGEKDAKEFQQVDYSKLVPILVQAIQELKSEIELLKQK
jgi:hypothetical protein